MRCMRSITMALTPVLVVVLVLLAGCATQKVVFQKPGVAQDDRKQDEGACLREAIGADGSGLIRFPYQIDRDASTKCMEARGYTAKPS